MPTARASHSCALVRNNSTGGAAEVLAMGGYATSALALVEAYNTKTDTWRTASGTSAVVKMFTIMLFKVDLILTNLHN
jgi:hypothetical protein